MGRYREPFSLFARKTKSGKIWYYRCYDEHGNRTVGRSTGETSKTRARQYCCKLLREGRIVPTKEISFSAYAAKWWLWDECDYIRGKLARSTTGKPRISRRYADDSRRILELHILPYFQNHWLSSISPKMIEDFMFSVRDRGFSAKRVNNILSCLRVMIGEAHRLGYLQKNPFDVVRPFATDERKGGVLSINEVRQLFDPANIKKVWEGHLLYRCITMLAAVTGARQGELLAIRDEDVHNGYIHIAHNWSLKYGLLPTKNRTVRDIPVPSRVLETMSPFLGTGGYVFPFNQGKSPATGNRLTEYFYKALNNMGISDEQRKQRQVNFHSWRFFFNSIMQGRKIAHAKVQSVIGHLSDQMTQHYTTFNLSDYEDVAKVQEDILNG